MHFSRIHTIHCTGRLGGEGVSASQGGVSDLGLSAQGGVCLGECLPRGCVCLVGCLPGGVC